MLYLCLQLQCYGTCYSGRDGQPGQDSQAGNLIVSVVNLATGDVEEFPSVYKYTLQGVQPFCSTSGVIEPGQRVELRGFEICNKGGMPTPATDAIVTMHGNACLLMEDKRNTWTVNHKLYPGKVLVVDQPLPFKVAPGMRAARPTEVLCVPTDLQISARFPRTNCEFRDFQTAPIPLTVMHPLEVSLVAGARACVFDWGVPVTITVRNKSRVGFGLAAPYGRLVRVTLELAEPSEHVFFTNESGLGSKLTPFSLASQMVFDIDYLAPLAEFTLSGTISISPEHATLYDQIRLAYSFSLGDIDSPLAQSGLEIIQSKTHSLQVGEYCQPIGESDCLLVVSGSTTLAEVEYWRECFKGLGYGMCVFNVSLYHGLSYQFRSHEICKELVGRIVVVLNNRFYRDDATELLNKEFYPLDYLENAEMFEAARRHSVRTYVINYTTAAVPVSLHHAEMSRFLMPMAALGVADKATRDAETFDGRTELAEDIISSGVARDEQLPAKYQYCRIKLFRMLFAPKESDFDSRMLALAERLRSCRPDRTYFVAKAYAPAVKGDTSKAVYFKRYDCGNIEVRRGLDTTYASIAFASVRRTRPTEQSQTINQFVLLKLLPLATKLALFTSIEPTDAAHYQVSLAIASDIADEQHVFLSCVRDQMVLWGDKKISIGNWLIALQTLQRFDFSDLCSKNAGGSGAVGDDNNFSKKSAEEGSTTHGSGREGGGGDEGVSVAIAVPIVEGAEDKEGSEVDGERARTNAENAKAATAPAADGESSPTTAAATAESVPSSSMKSGNNSPAARAATAAVQQLPRGSGAEALSNLLLRLCFMASQYNKAHMIKSNFLAKAVLDTCAAIFRSYLGVVEEEDFKARVSAYIDTQQLAKDDDLVAKLRDPHDIGHEVFFNHWYGLKSIVVSGTQALRQPPTLTLMRPQLADMNVGGEYTKAVEFYAKAPQYHIQKLPVLYPVHPKEELLMESPGRKQSYFARGQQLDGSAKADA